VREAAAEQMFSTSEEPSISHTFARGLTAPVPTAVGPGSQHTTGKRQYLGLGCPQEPATSGERDKGCP